MKKTICTSLSVIVVACGFVYGQGAQAASNPAHFNWGVVEVTPQLVAGLKYDDNLYRDDRNISTPVMVVKPSVDFRAISGLNEYAIQFEAINRTYTRAHEADSTDVGFSGSVHHEFTTRHRLDMNADWGSYYDEGSEVGSTREFPRYEQRQIGGTYGFGSLQAAHIDVFTSYDDRGYKDSGFNDRSILRYGSTFYYRVMPNTRALFEVSKRELDYVDISNAGYDITSYLVGLSMDTSSKTTGFLKAGRRYRKTKVEGTGTEGYTGWEMGLSYQPVSYSLIQLSAGRDYGLESDNPENPDFTQGNTINLSWSHDWTGKVASRLGWRYVSEDILNFAGIAQKDRTVNTYNAGLDWKVRRWVTLALDWNYNKRRESAVQPGTFEDNYSRNTFMLSGRFSL